MNEQWAEINAEIKLGRIPWIKRVGDSTLCLWHIYASPDDDTASIDDILIGRRCVNLTRWRFVSGEGSDFAGGPYCFTHMRKILSTEHEIGRFQKLIEFRKTDEERRRTWRGTP